MRNVTPNLFFQATAICSLIAWVCLASAVKAQTDGDLKVQCFLQEISQGLAPNRSVVSYAWFKEELRRELGTQDPLSARETRLAQLWYQIARPEDVNFISRSQLLRGKDDSIFGAEYGQNDQQRSDYNSQANLHRLQRLIQPLASVIRYMRDPARSTAEAGDAELLSKISASSFGFIGHLEQKKSLLIERFLGSSPDSISANWESWAADPSRFMTEMKKRIVSDTDQRIDPDRGVSQARELARDPGFQSLRERDPDFAEKVLWLKEKTSDPDRFSAPIASFLKSINENYSRLLDASGSERSPFSEELQPALKNVLLRKAYLRSVEQSIRSLGLESVNLDELYGIRGDDGNGRVLDAVFASDLLSKGYVFWDRGLSSIQQTKSGHGRDLHVLQAILYGQLVDNRFGAGTFAKFFEKMGRPDQMGTQTSERPTSGTNRIFYRYGWMPLFDDVFNVREPFFSFSTNSMAFQAMLPLIVD